MGLKQTNPTMQEFSLQEPQQPTKEMKKVIRPETTKLNIAKGTTDPRVEFKSQVLTHILIRFDRENLHQASNSKYPPNISISTKLKLQNLDQT